MTDIRPLDEDRIDDLTELFASDDVADRCWCMWFIVSVKHFHVAGHSGNRTDFVSLMRNESQPLGLIAYRAEQPVGWCALGPRSRFARAITTPTLRHRDGDDESIWFVPCFFVHPDHRSEGVAARLLDAAIEHASAAGAVALEGFPRSGPARPTSGSDLMTGHEALFTSVGFSVRSRPSNKRVIMRRGLA